jgi:hypothetical protein
MQLSFFLGASPWLDDRSPLEALRAGELDAVLRAARRFAEQGGA